MIRINNKDVIGIYKNNIPIIAVYTKGLLVWPTDEDLLFIGYWADELFWDDNSYWID